MRSCVGCLAAFALAGLAWLTHALGVIEYPWEFGYYAYFNRVRKIVERTPGIRVESVWKHQDLTLQDFGFTLTTSRGWTVHVNFLGASRRPMRSNAAIAMVVALRIAAAEAGDGSRQ